jgi:acid phosphatase (class A)
MVRSGASVGGDLPRIRANTEDYRKYVNIPPDSVIPAQPKLLRFFRYWDAELQAYEYLNDFLTKQFPTWQTTLLGDVGTPAGPPNLTPPHRFVTGLDNEIKYILDSAPDRQDRFAEIIGQNSGEGAIGYFLGMLMIDPARMPATNLLIRVARRLGEHIVMCLKGYFLCPRPSQLCPAIVPMIDPPATPSFPSGHSLQAWLIWRCLDATNPPMRPRHLVRDLANRIGENRIIAGIHYPQDHEIGKAVGDWVYTRLLFPLAAGTPFKLLVTAATAEMANQWGQPPAVLQSGLSPLNLGADSP